MLAIVLNNEKNTTSLASIFFEEISGHTNFTVISGIVKEIVSPPHPKEQTCVSTKTNMIFMKKQKSLETYIIFYGNMQDEETCFTVALYGNK